MTCHATPSSGTAKTRLEIDGGVWRKGPASTIFGQRNRSPTLTPRAQGDVSCYGNLPLGLGSAKWTPRSLSKRMKTKHFLRTSWGPKENQPKQENWQAAMFFNQGAKSNTTPALSWIIFAALPQASILGPTWCSQVSILTRFMLRQAMQIQVITKYCSCMYSKIHHTYAVYT